MSTKVVSEHYLNDYLRHKTTQGHTKADIDSYLNLVGYRNENTSSNGPEITMADEENVTQKITELLAQQNPLMVATKPKTKKRVSEKSSVKPKTPEKLEKTDLVKLISYLRLSITQHIPKLTIYAHLIKHGWDKKLIEKAYGVALHAVKEHVVTDLADSHEIRKDTRFLLSQIDELSAQVSLKKAKLALSKEALQNQKSKKYAEKIHSKYTSAHFYTKTKQKLSDVAVKEKLRKAKMARKETPQSKHLKQIEAELAKIHTKMAQQETITQVVRPVMMAPVQRDSAIGSPLIQTQDQIKAQSEPVSKSEPVAPSVTPHKTEITQNFVPDKVQLAKVEAVAKKSSSYTKPTFPPENLTINAASINVVGPNGGSGSNSGSGMGGRTVTNNYHDQGGELGLYNPIKENELEYVDSPIGDRVPVGIPDLDGVISGGLKPRTTTLVSGGAGTGKSTFGLQYLVSGIIKNNEPGVYITFEQTREAVISLGEQFGWDLEHLESEGMLIIHEYTPEQISKALQAGGGSVRDMVDSINAKRIVLDSITEYKMLFHSEIDQRKELTSIFKSFAKWGCTTIIVGQEHSDSKAHISSVLDYESDAVILLYNERRGDIRQRSLEIYKMRDTKHAGRIFPMELTDNGMLVHTKEAKLVAGRR